MEMEGDDAHLLNLLVFTSGADCISVMYGTFGDFRKYKQNKLILSRFKGQINPKSKKKFFSHFKATKC